MYFRELFPFQKEVVKKMIIQGRFINGDDTGLGKTDTAIFVAEHWLWKNKDQRIIIICLNETKEQWTKRIKLTTFKKNNIFCTYENGKTIAKKNRITLYNEINKFQYIVLTYNNIATDLEYLNIDNPCMIVFDECRKLKTRNSALHKNSFKLVQYLLSKNRDLKIYGLDATLLPNKAVEEVFWIFEILNPTVFGTGNYNWYKFSSQFIIFNYFGGVDRYKNQDLLYSKVKPYFTKRHHSHPAIAPYIPKKVEKYYTCEVGNKKLYNTVAEKLLYNLDMLADLVNRQYNDKLEQYEYNKVLLMIKKLDGVIKSQYNTLIQICFHSGILLTSEGGFNKKFIEEYKVKLDLKEKGKALFICNRVKQLIEEDDTNKILVMCYFIEGLNILKEILRENNIKSLIYRGDANKEIVLNEFKTNKSIKVLLLQSTIGGCSLDIPQANHIFRDIMETPADMKQQNRITRLGSSFSMNVLHDVVCKGTVDEKIYKDNFRKEALSSFITEGTKLDKKFLNEDGSVKAKLNSLRDFLRKNLDGVRRYRKINLKGGEKVK